MSKVYPLLIGMFIMIAVQSCSKKTHPTATPTTVNTHLNSDTTVATKKNDSTTTNKPTVKRKAQITVPKVIVVNDKYASKSVDGRYYYDLQGHRYWRNNKDGKYYLFNKSMLTDDAFKKL